MCIMYSVITWTPASLPSPLPSRFSGCRGGGAGQEEEGGGEPGQGEGKRQRTPCPSVQSPPVNICQTLLLRGESMCLFICKMLNGTSIIDFHPIRI